MSNPAQLFLLADHIKLSLLERQRAVSLKLEPFSQDGEISRSLDSLRDGVESLASQIAHLEETDDPSSADLRDQKISLKKQLDDLTSQFYGNNNPSSDATLKTPNDSSLAEDFSRASSTSTTLKHPAPQHPISKSVRFTDSLATTAEEEDPNRKALLHPYRDSPSPPTFDHSSLSNPEIHAHHAQIMQEQDDELDRLGESIGRQHELSIQIGDELEGHIALLDEVDGYVDRHASRLDGAKKRLGKFRRNAGEGRSLMTIIGLIIVLVILIVILK
ncbi:v-SNARE [Paracoccidioides lutzii Pb01]|uniref:V-SNARE n=1 Tax=Paracoccidioides lutzii (strain ATCC MYA-826 / Pb01) TaxID=502779 RepID=C1GZI0_PARBA|nr:v-SNARE [Paracoccidioides lutzii Pb01]EEH42003.1 v-SNARE [Paracoccidioides lutzii Pb01]